MFTYFKNRKSLKSYKERLRGKAYALSILDEMGLVCGLQKLGHDYELGATFDPTDFDKGITDIYHEFMHLEGGS